MLSRDEIVPHGLRKNRCLPTDGSRYKGVTLLPKANARDMPLTRFADDLRVSFTRDCAQFRKCSSNLFNG